MAKHDDGGPARAEIPFTQYLMPDGRKKAVLVERPIEVASVAHGLIERGVAFAVEMLPTGDISMTAETEPSKDTEDETIAHELCANGPEVPLAVDLLVASATAMLAEKRRRESREAE